MEDFTRLKLYFERKEIVVAWFKEASWLHSLLGDYVIRPLRPSCISSELSSAHYSADCISSLVQRYIEVHHVRLLLINLFYECFSNIVDNKNSNLKTI